MKMTRAERRMLRHEEWNTLTWPEKLLAGTLSLVLLTAMAALLVIILTA